MISPAGFSLAIKASAVGAPAAYRRVGREGSNWKPSNCRVMPTVCQDRPLSVEIIIAGPRVLLVRPEITR